MTRHNTAAAMAGESEGFAGRTSALDECHHGEDTTRLRPRTDEELMLACQRSDRAAFEELYDRYAKPIYNLFCRAGQHEAAEDLVLRTFLELHIARNRWHPTESLRAWIFILARNVLRDAVSTETGAALPGVTHGA